MEAMSEAERYEQGCLSRELGNLSVGAYEQGATVVMPPSAPERPEASSDSEAHKALPSHSEIPVENLRGLWD